ncbi:Thiolase, N-terminal domain-containing protein [Xylariaceae sp. FL0255]|nr:Thiolase, N-terminal domain-containing protein [Xylariaceae sp. FL0255]
MAAMVGQPFQFSLANAVAQFSSSQQSLPSTEDPASPRDAPPSFKPPQISPPRVIASSLTPPPSSQQIAPNNHNHNVDYAYSQPTNRIMSPPPTTQYQANHRGRNSPVECIPPTPDQINNGSVEELRRWLQQSLSLNAKLKSETAHHKLQYNLLSMQSAEDASRAKVEHDMTRREVEYLLEAEHSRQARRELDARSDPTKIKYRELQQAFDKLSSEHKAAQRHLKNATKVIRQQAEEKEVLSDENQMLLTRIRENREHFRMLCSPGGVFHGALTPETPSMPSPQQARTTPRHTPRSVNRDMRRENDPSAAGFEALLHALSQDNSAPSTPTTNTRSAPRVPFRQHRNVHSMSSLPTTPFSRPRGNNPALLPSIDLVPQTEPAQRFTNNRFAPQTPTQVRDPRSRESTISADEDEGDDHIQRQPARPRTMTLESVAAAAQSYLSHGSHSSSQRRGAEEEEVWESQASQAASEMLRRDARESFEVASSVGSRDPTPGPMEKSLTNKQQTKLYGPINKAGLTAEKRKAKMKPRGWYMGRPSAFYNAGGGVKNRIADILVKSPKDIVILSAFRTPICRAYRGKFKDAYPEELLAAVLRATMKRVRKSKRLVDDICVGTVLSELGGSKAVRMMVNHIGFDTNKTSVYTAIENIGSALRSGTIEFGIAAGMESMTRNYGTRAIPQDVWPEMKESEVQDARDCLMPMGLTAEKVAEKFGIERDDADWMAALSYERAVHANMLGVFKNEIVPVTTRYQEVDSNGHPIGSEQMVTVDTDEGFRKHEHDLPVRNLFHNVLNRQKKAFSEDGICTAGNSSQISDGAAALLMTTRENAVKHNLQPFIVGRYIGSSIAGCEPSLMGVGPIYAIPQLLERYGLKMSDIARWEINEAFAAQAVACVRELQLDVVMEAGDLNPDGGAIALGHPLGATGARMATTLLHGLHRIKGEERMGRSLGVASMCVGTGMGMAGLFARE